MTDYTFCFHGIDLLVPEVSSDADAARGLPASAIPSCQDDFSFDRGDARVRILSMATGEPIPLGFRALTARMALTAAANCASGSDGALQGEANAQFQSQVLPFLSAVHILQWRSESLYCGRCGSPNGDAPDELARLCPRCGRREYPRISPAVIVRVEDDRGRILLAHNTKFREGMHGLLAGFVEAGETLESTVAREIREEVGIEVGDIRYLSSQSWPFPNSLMLAFSARYKGGDLKPDGIEIETVDWYAPASLPLIPSLGAVARTLIDEWLASQSVAQPREP